MFGFNHTYWNTVLYQMKCYIVQLPEFKNFISINKAKLFAISLPRKVTDMAIYLSYFSNLFFFLNLLFRKKKAK